MICIPRSLCSWDFQISDASAGAATADFDFFTEQGAISLGETTYNVWKHGPFSGRWTMEKDGRTAATAEKPSALFRLFDVRTDNIAFIVKAQSVAGRSYDLVLSDVEVGVICPMHPFTRRTFIECSAKIPEFVQLFAFWLAVLTWRRAANHAAQ